MDLISSRSLIVAAPAQNREGYENALERVMPLLSARVLGKLAGQTASIDLWNNYGAKMDTAYASQRDQSETRRDYSQNILKDRYDTLESIGLIESNEQKTIITDDSNEVVEWTHDRLDKMLQSGMIYSIERETYVCDNCDKTIGIVTDRVASRLSCQTCPGQTYHAAIRSALFMDVNPLQPNILLPRKSRHTASHSVNVPPVTAIERNRSYGLALDSIGSDYVLDPKIGLAMMYDYVAETRQVSDFLVVQGKETLYNTAPYVQTVAPHLTMRYILTPHIPKGQNIEDVQRLGSGFVSRYLPLFIVDRSNDVGQQQISDLHKEYSNARAYMDKMAINEATAESSSIPKAQALSVEVDSLIGQAKLREAVMATRNKLIKHMGTSGLFAASFDDHPDLDTIRDRINTIYGT